MPLSPGRKKKVCTPAQRTFVANLVVNCMSIASAARACSITEQTAHQWLKQPHVKAELQRRQAIISNISNVSAAEVIGILVDFARANIADLLPDNPIVAEAQKNGVAHLIKEIRVEEKVLRAVGSEGEQILNRTTHLKLVDSQAALGLLSKMLGLENRDDESERCRVAIRTAMAIKQICALDAITLLAPHMPGVVKLRAEFEGQQPVIDMPKGEL